MKIGLQTWGSNGDIRPMIALADGLRQASHEVTLVIASIDSCLYDQQCAQYQIPCRHVPAQISFDLPAFAKKTFRMNAAQWLVELLKASFFPMKTRSIRHQGSWRAKTIWLSDIIFSIR